jgi:hypothetical protein
MTGATETFTSLETREIKRVSIKTGGACEPFCFEVREVGKENILISPPKESTVKIKNWANKTATKLGVPLKFSIKKGSIIWESTAALEE